jgi:hypothetical protein
MATICLPDPELLTVATPPPNVHLEGRLDTHETSEEFASTMPHSITVWVIKRQMDAGGAYAPSIQHRIAELPWRWQKETDR